MIQCAKPHQRSEVILVLTTSYLRSSTRYLLQYLQRVTKLLSLCVSSSMYFLRVRVTQSNRIDNVGRTEIACRPLGVYRIKVKMAFKHLPVPQ